MSRCRSETPDLMDGFMNDRPNSGRDRWYWFRSWWLVAAVVVVGIVGLSMANQRRGGDWAVAGYRLVAEFPHDAKAFTQGLIVVGGQMYEGTGKNGESSLRKIDLTSGRVETIVPLDPSYFGEGITAMDGKIFQLTWQNRL